MEFTIGGTTVSDVKVGSASVKLVSVDGQYVWARSAGTLYAKAARSGTFKLTSWSDANGSAKSLPSSTSFSLSAGVSKAVLVGVCYGDKVYFICSQSSATSTGSKTASGSVKITYSSSLASSGVPSAQTLSYQDITTYSYTTPYTASYTSPATISAEGQTISIGAVAGSSTSSVQSTSEGKVTLTSSYPSRKQTTIGTGTKKKYVTYAFQGWSASSEQTLTTAELASNAATYSPGGSYRITSNLTLYPVWLSTTSDIGFVEG